MKIKKSKFAVNESALIISDMMTAKMEGFPSVSTSCLSNPYCIARFKKGYGVCKHCFAKNNLSFKPGLRENCQHNYDLLNSRLLKYEEFPILKDDVEMCRIESYGDVGSVIQARNYIRFCKINPHVRFAAWTKNPGLWDKAIEKDGKPNNLICILSSLQLNKPTEIHKKYGWIDYVFTVYDKGYIKEHNVNINCGARSCITCQKCYKKDGRTKYIKEQLK